MRAFALSYAGSCSDVSGYLSVPDRSTVGSEAGAAKNLRGTPLDRRDRELQNLLFANVIQIVIGAQ